MDQQTFSNLTDIPLPPNALDTLEQASYVSALIKFINNAQMPTTIALQGEWGSGKTSLMNQIAGQLCLNYETICKFSDENYVDSRSQDDFPYLGVWVNTWQYSLMKDERESLVSIVQGITSQITQQVSMYLKDNATSKVISSRLLGALRFAAVATTKVGLGFVGGNPNSIDNLINGNSSNIPEQHDPDFFRNELQKAIIDFKRQISEYRKTLKQSSPFKGFIFFVDDLDRLDPPVAVQILSLMKNLFEVNNCIFILAIDYEVVIKGLEKRFGKKTEENEREYRSFFDKIIQLSFRLPVSQYKIDNYLKEGLKNICYTGSKSGSETTLNEIISDLNAITIETCGTNPRAIKRMLNTLSLVKEISVTKMKKLYAENTELKFDLNRDPEDIKLYLKLLFAMVCAQVSYPILYENLISEPDLFKWTSINSNSMDDDGSDDSSAAKPMYLDPTDFMLESIVSKDIWMRKRINNIGRYLAMLVKLIVDNKKRKGDPSLDTTADYISLITDFTSVTSATSDEDQKLRRDQGSLTKFINALKEAGYGDKIRDNANKFMERFFHCYSPKNLIINYDSDNRLINISCSTQGKAIAMLCQIDFRDRPKDRKDRFMIFNETGGFFSVVNEVKRSTPTQTEDPNNITDENMKFVSDEYLRLTGAVPLSWQNNVN
jgi:hypothetical protein